MCSQERQPQPESAVSAFLSFLFPGIGQAYNRQYALALLLAAPILLAIVVVGASLMAPDSFVSRLIDLRTLAALAVLNLALLGWRIIAIVQAHRRRASFDFRHWPTWLTAVLVVATMAMHALATYYVLKTIETLAAVGSDAQAGSPAAGGGDRLILPAPSEHPEVSRGERVAVLLVGIDFGPGRSHQLTDTMLVASVDPETGQGAMVSIPRDMYGVPLPDGRRYDGKLNSLMATAEGNPERFPLGGPGTLKAVIGDLLGTDIHYFAAVDLAGLMKAVDAVGGVDVTVTEPVHDPTYIDEFGAIRGFSIEPGVHHMDGATALAYARSRMGAGDSDFTRAERQQNLLVALRTKLTAGSLLLSLPTLLDAVKASLVTDIPTERFPGLVEVVENADEDIERVVLAPPNYVSPEPFSSAGYILHPDLAAIRRLGERLFGSSPVGDS